MMLKNYLSVICILVVIDLQIAGCATSRLNPFSAPAKVADSALDEQKTLILTAEEAQLAENPQAALEQFDAYLKRFPVSGYTAQAHLGRGRSLEKLGKFTEAIEVYRLVGEFARTQSPTQAGQAYVRLSYCYEHLGDEGRLQLALQDALSFGEALPVDVRLIEIPTRQAASDLRRGEAAAARKTLKKVEEDLPAVNSESPAPVQDRQAELLLGMGSMNLAGLSAENYLPQLESFEALQHYLWRSFSMNRRPYSEAALEKLHVSYTQFANLAFNPPKIKSGLAVDVAERSRKELQRRWISRLLETVQNLRSFSEDKAADTSLQFGKLLAQIENGGEKILRRPGVLTPLSVESKNRNQLKRVVEPTEPTATATNAEDPNLKKNPSGANDPQVSETP